MPPTTDHQRGRALLKRAATFAEVLRLAMGEMSQRQAADAIGVSESRISRWLHGGLPSDKTLDLAAAWLGVEPDDLASFLRHQRAATSTYDARSTRDRMAEMEREMAELRQLIERLSNSLDRPVDGEGRHS